MTDRSTCAGRRLLLPALASLLLVAAPAQDGDARKGLPQEDPVRARLHRLQSAGCAAPLSIYPVRVLERADARVAEALGLVLESQGMADLELAADAFAPARDTAWADLPAAFAAHRRQAAAAEPRRYALYAEFLGTPKTGPTEVRFVLVDPDGEVVLQDRQVPGDADFRRTAGRDPDPLGCATLVGDRLFRLAGWKKAPGSVVDPKFARRWRERSGVPGDAELAAMRQRMTALGERLDTARIAVLPTLVGGGHDAASAARLAELVRAECRGAAPAPGTKLVVAPSANEQKRLWDLARALQDAVKKSPVDADYVLVADLGLDPEKGSGYVHVAICTAKGEFVFADFVNDQHPLFRARRPKTLADAEWLAAARLHEAWR